MRRETSGGCDRCDWSTTALTDESDSVAVEIAKEAPVKVAEMCRAVGEDRPVCNVRDRPTLKVEDDLQVVVEPCHKLGPLIKDCFHEVFPEVSWER